MKEYLTYEEYKEMGLADVDESEYKPLSIFATRIVSAYTFGVIDRDNLLDDPDYSDIIKEATALQVDFIQRKGGADVASGAEETAGLSSESETIGNYSHSASYSNVEGQRGKAVYVGIMQVSPAAVSLLAPIQALGRRVRGICPQQKAIL